MIHLKKWVSILVFTSIMTPVFAQSEKQLTLINTSASGYMTVSYGFCGDACEVEHHTINIYSKKDSPDQKNYITISIPDDPDYYGVTIHDAVEKEVIDGKPSEKVIAKTSTDGYVCSNVYKKDRFLPLHVIELSDGNGSPFVTCKFSQT